MTEQTNKTYQEMMVEAIDLASLVSNPFARSLGGSTLFGAFKAIEKLTTDAIVSGAKFIIKNPHYLIAAYLFIDYGILDKGPMTKQIRKYFVDSFPGHANAFYDRLAEITADNKIQPKEVIETIALIYKHYNKSVNESVSYKEPYTNKFNTTKFSPTYTAVAGELGTKALKAGGLAALAYAYLKAKEQIDKAERRAENLKYRFTS